MTKRTNPELTRTQEIPCFTMASLAGGRDLSAAELDRLECLAAEDDGSNDDGIVRECLAEDSMVTVRLDA